LPKIEEDGKSWLRRPKLYKRVAEPHKKRNLPLLLSGSRPGIYVATLK